jgi:hypothetical protein
MKICPNCHSSYSDETLNFCLVDGAPLVKADVSRNITSSTNQEETLIDSKIHNLNLTERKQPALPTQSFVNSRSRKFLFLGLIGLAVLGLGIFFFLQDRMRPSSEPVVVSRQVSISTRKNDNPIPPDQMDRIKSEIAQMLANWAATNSNKDLEGHLAHYVDTLEIYYTESNKDKNHVRADRLRAYQKYDSISIQVQNLQILLDSEQVAMVVFDKMWVMKSPQKISTGAVQQEMKLVRLNNKWLIASERDSKVYYINNLEPQSASSNFQQSNPNFLR